MTMTDHPEADATPEDTGEETPEPTVAAEQAPPDPVLPAAVGELPSFPGFQEMQGMASMAVTLAAAAAVPAAMQNKPNDVFLVLLTGRELGIPPTTAIRECHVIDGKVTISPKLKLALVRSAGVGRIWADPANDGQSATWYGVRHDEPDITHASTFTLADAQAAELASKKNWRHYPKRMLSWRALGYLLDDVFSEVGTGLYSPDEMGAMTDDEGRVIDIPAADPLPGTSAPKGLRPAAPPPPDPPASKEDLEAIAQRLAKITAIPSARKALLEMWTKPKEGGAPTLPPPGDLLARQVKVAQAMLSSIELRIKKGEWEDEVPQAPLDAGTDLPAEPEFHDGNEGDEEARKARAEQVAKEDGLTGEAKAEWDAQAPVADSGVQPPAAEADSATTEATAAQDEEIANPSVCAALLEAIDQLLPRTKAAVRKRLADEGIDLDEMPTMADAERAEAIIDELTPEPFPDAG